ncbi:sulfotransferase family protein [[Mycobacterium] wendilense]|uniref:Sulfotransferase family protein n=1 Tax=[Mycobacterium] wendilense TaxID=3064284 RepID=A0ABN9P9I6_9MYCO|nr:sulfotransferase family protein [Mycolicibacterium sp. MU0050]CAJ1587164.1 sulfotransferase family protein [Mycolicibacterium sp. MU0050]
MGRSGTSALTRALSLSGVAMPPGMLGADANNPRGYWEPRAALHLNEKFLYRHGSSYFDPTLRLQDEGVLSDEEKTQFSAQIADYLRELPTAPVTVIKVLHISLLCDAWFNAARMAGYDIAAVLAVRDPTEVNRSLAKFMQATPQLASALWLKYNLLAEQHTRGLPRVFVDYTNLLEDWRRELKRISAILPIALDTGDDSPVDEFLEPSLRRQRESGPVEEPFGTDWLTVAYDTLRAAANDDPWDEAVLDRVFGAYQASERGFRTSLDDFRGHFNLRYRFSRKFMKPLYEAVAIAHGRKGTWA